MAFNVARAGEHAYHLTNGGRGPRANEQVDEEAGDAAPQSPGFQKQVSHYELEFDENLNLQHIKEGFIRKVYLILAIQMAYTSSIVAAMTFNPSFGQVGLVLGNNWLMIIPMICVICALQAKKDQYPTNVILLWVFTTMISFMIGGVCWFRYSQGDGLYILASVIVTGVVFFALTAVVWIVGDKFGWMGKFLFVALTANIMFLFIAYLLGLSGMTLIYNIFGVMIFTGYILYDTNQIVNKVRIEDADTGTAIIGAVELYMDIINLFLHILSLMGGRDN